MSLFRLKKQRPTYDAVLEKFDSLRVYLISDNQKPRSVRMFSDMVDTYNRMDKSERAEKRNDFRGLISDIESIVIEEHGFGHVLAGIITEYLNKFS